MPSQLKILFVDDHIGIRDAITSMLVQKNTLFQISTAVNKAEAVKVLSENPEISVCIMDLNLNGESGLDVVKALRLIKSDLNVLIYSMYKDPLHIEQSLSSQVQGYVSKDASIDELEKAVLIVSQGQMYFNRQAKETMYVLLNKNGSADTSRTEENSRMQQVYSLYQTLSQKEKDIMYYLAQKKEPDEIAKILGKSEKTIVNQKSIIYSKMNIRDRLELMEDAKLLGLII